MHELRQPGRAVLAAPATVARAQPVAQAGRPQPGAVRLMAPGRGTLVLLVMRQRSIPDTRLAGSRRTGNDPRAKRTRLVRSPLT